MDGSAQGRERFASALTHPVIRTAVEFAARLGIRVTGATVRERLAAAPRFPALGLIDIQEAFDAWGLPSAAFSTTPEHLRDIPLPVLTAIDQRDEDRASAGRVIVVVTAWTDAGVEFSHPIFGPQHLAWDDFLAARTGPMFAAGADTAGGEGDYDARLAAERASAAAYRQSVALIPSFLTPDECAALIAACESGGLFGPSPLASHSGKTFERPSRMRTSSTALLPRPGAGPYDALYARAADVVGIDPACFERLQCVRYDPGQRFYPHVDGMARTHTLLVYLNDDFAGGETVFPDIDLTITPQRGLAALFRNLDDGGNLIPWSRHGGQPPRDGRKYACNFWARAHPLPEAH